jgi:hypothetical protein
LAHANNYASSRESADKTVAAVKLARNWIAVLREVLDGQQDTASGELISHPGK